MRYINWVLGFFIYSNFSTEWKTQNDDIEQIKLINRPNIYLFQPDGYVNFSEINKELLQA